MGVFGCVFSPSCRWCTQGGESCGVCLFDFGVILKNRETPIAFLTNYWISCISWEHLIKLLLELYWQGFANGSTIGIVWTLRHAKRHPSWVWICEYLSFFPEKKAPFWWQNSFGALSLPHGCCCRVVNCVLSMWWIMITVKTPLYQIARDSDWKAAS